jgi:hypothetical protein
MMIGVHENHEIDEVMYETVRLAVTSKSEECCVMQVGGQGF